MYEESEEFARFYEALVLFQTRAIGYTMSGENTADRVARAKFVVKTIEKANNKFERRAPQPLAFHMASAPCGSGLVNCGGVCVDPKGCWGRASPELTTRDSEE